MIVHNRWSIDFVPQFFSRSMLVLYSFHQSKPVELCDDDYDELLNVNNLSTNENKADTGFPFLFAQSCTLTIS